MRLHALVLAKAIDEFVCDDRAIAGWSLQDRPPSLVDEGVTLIVIRGRDGRLVDVAAEFALDAPHDQVTDRNPRFCRANLQASVQSIRYIDRCLHALHITVFPYCCASAQFGLPSSDWHQAAGRRNGRLDLVR